MKDMSARSKENESQRNAKLRVCVIEDEILALRRLVRGLSRLAEVEVVGTAATGEEGLRLIEELNPDLAFLDIEMPGISGVEVGRELARRATTDFVFVTALVDFAVDAFEMHATDYIIKPAQDDRLKETVNRALNRRNMRVNGPNVEAVEGLSCFWVPRGKSTVRVPTQDIRRIEAAKDYVLLYTIDHTYIYKITMKELEQRLRSEKLVRVHRSSFLRLDSVSKADFSGRRLARVHTEDGAVVEVSTRYAQAVAEALRTL